MHEIFDAEMLVDIFASNIYQIWLCWKDTAIKFRTHLNAVGMDWCSIATRRYCVTLLFIHL